MGILDQISGSSGSNGGSQNGLPTSMNDPRMQQVVDYVNAHGGDPKQVAMQLAGQSIGNPFTYLSSLLRR